MPKIKSKSQLRWAYANRGKLKAAREAISEFHGKTTRGLPERKGKRKKSRKRSRG